MKRILIGLMAILLVAGMLGAGTSAYFSSTVQSTSNDFTTGTLTLGINNSGDDFTHNTVSATWHAPTGWAPGQSFTSQLQIKDTGSINVPYLELDFNHPVGTTGPNGGTGWDLNGDSLADHIFVTGWHERVGDGSTIDDLGPGQYFQHLVKNGDDTFTLKELIQSYRQGTNEGALPPSGGDCSTVGPSNEIPWQADEFGKCVRQRDDGVTGSGYDVTPGNVAAIVAGGTYVLEMTFTLDPALTNTYQGTSLSMDVTFTGIQDLSQRY